MIEKTLRDEFAMNVIGMLCDSYPPEATASMAYEYAAEMLREKQRVELAKLVQEAPYGSHPYIVNVLKQVVQSLEDDPDGESDKEVITQLRDATRMLEALRG